MQKYNVGDKVIFKMIHGYDKYEEYWSGIISHIYDNHYRIVKDGVIVPDITRKNIHFTHPDIDIHFYQNALIAPYVDKEGDDEKRMTWQSPEMIAARNMQIQILQRQIDEENNQYDDILFAKFQIGEQVNYINDSEDFPWGGACGGIIGYSGLIINLDRASMQVTVKTNDAYVQRQGDIRYLNKI
jgi:hypothetical protein